MSLTKDYDDYKSSDEYQLMKGLAEELAIALAIIPLPDKIKESPFGQKVKDLLELSGEVLDFDDSDIAAFKLSVSTVSPEPHRFTLSLDLYSFYKSLWLGWWLVTWTVGERPWQVEDFSIEFQR